MGAEKEDRIEITNSAMEVLKRFKMIWREKRKD